jgi:DNA gyrase/topoisomerase IV subunit B
MEPEKFTILDLAAPTLKFEEVTFIPAVLKAIGEIIDNSVDEFTHIGGKGKLDITADPSKGSYVISDNGRGVPIDIHEAGVHTPQVVFGLMRSGRNFDDDSKTQGVIGVNGVGSACTNFCSTTFNVTIQRDGKRYFQRFEQGEVVSAPKIIKSADRSTGTSISFTLDSAVFADVSLPPVLSRNRAIEIAMTNPGVVVTYNGEKYVFKKGMADVLKSKLDGKDSFTFSIADGKDTSGEFVVVLNAHSERDEKVFTWVNSSLLYGGGICNTQFINAFTDKMIDHLESRAKRAKIKIHKDDVRQGLLALGNLKIKGPAYDSQSKTRLTGPSLRRDIDAMVESQWPAFVKKNKEWIEEVFRHAEERYHTKANASAQKEHQKRSRASIDGLLDATGKDRMKCSLLISEGISAAANFCQVRDPATVGAFALTGKINNVYGATPAQVLNMGKLSDLLAAIGLTPGRRAVRGELNFGRIIIATDADHDGSSILLLLTNLFYQFWPELFKDQDNPVVYRLIAPNVCAVKGDKFVHFASLADFDKVRDKYKGYEIEYYKGLGSMRVATNRELLTNLDSYLIPIVDDGNLRSVLELTMGDDSDARKKWLTEE